MDFGLGIHGEPGISSAAWMPAAELARTLVESVLAERSDGADGRAAVLLNGLGATKYEELFALYGEVAVLLENRGLQLVQPEFGELVTSLDMAGCSLSVTWLDDELERLWAAPADTPAFRRGEAGGYQRFTERHHGAAEEVATDETEASEASKSAAVIVRDVVAAISAIVEQHKDYLGEIDAVAGDGDHGIGMSRGAKAAAEAAAESKGGVQTVLTAAGAAFGDKAGGTSGILWGVLLASIGRGLGNEEAVTAARTAEAVSTAAVRLQAFSKANLGDKTMLDALFPFVEALSSEVGSGSSLAQAWQRAAGTCVEAAAATAPMVPTIGRARPLAERSIGTPDPGTISLGLIVTSIGEVLAAAGTEDPHEGEQ